MESGDRLGSGPLPWSRERRRVLGTLYDVVIVY